MNAGQELTSRTLNLPFAVDVVDEEELLELILKSAAGHESRIITYATAHTIVQSHRHPEFLDIMTRVDTCYADGMGVVLAARIVSASKLQKVTANDFFPVLIDACHRQDLRVALVGGRDGVATTALNRILTGPESKVGEKPAAHEWCRAYAGFSDRSEEERMLCELEDWAPHLICVGMGQPRQEAWSLEVRKRLSRTTFHCVGGLFDLFSGNIASPPLMLRRVGGEWLFRLWDQPRATWRRYVLGLPMFAFLVLREAFRVRLLKRQGWGSGGRP